MHRARRRRYRTRLLIIRKNVGQISDIGTSPNIRSILFPVSCYYFTIICLRAACPTRTKLFQNLLNVHSRLDISAAHTFLPVLWDSRKPGKTWSYASFILLQQSFYVLSPLLKLRLSSIQQMDSIQNLFIAYRHFTFYHRQPIFFQFFALTSYMFHSSA